MVRALLDGRKTQTRRLVKPQPPENVVDAGVISSGTESNGTWYWLDCAQLEWASTVGDEFRCPYGVPGDALWVRETIRAEELDNGDDGVRYAADGAWRPIENTAEAGERWVDLNHYGKRRGAQVPGIHMPRWACRLRLRITDVRVERLQAITDADAIAEGVIAAAIYGGKVGSWLPAADLRDRFYDTAREAYLGLWDHINGKDAAAENPWVWAVSFEVIR